MGELRRRHEELRAELLVREATEKDLRAALEEATAVKGWRSWRWVGQLPALLTSLAAVGALVYTGQGLAQSQAASTEQSRLAESGQITDRFNTAVTNLGSTTITTRLGGIYALQRIMHDSPPDQRAIVEVLSAFIRTQAPVSPGGAAAGAMMKPVTDIQAALTVLVTRTPANDGSNVVAHYDLPPVSPGGERLTVDTTKPIVDLHGAELAGADLVAAKLADADLDGADLSHADLTGADLSRTTFVGAKLTGAVFDGNTNLRSTRFDNADLTSADLTSVDLTNTIIVGTNLTGAKLLGAQIEPVIFDNSANNLTGADLAETALCAESQPTEPRATYTCG